jgi:hypothetical protein
LTQPPGTEGVEVIPVVVVAAAMINSSHHSFFRRGMPARHTRSCLCVLAKRDHGERNDDESVLVRRALAPTSIVEVKTVK